MKFILRIFVVGFVVLSSSLGVMGQTKDNDRLYNTLDSLLDNQQSIVRDKEHRINIIREGLHKKNISQEEVIQINRRLYEEYMELEG